MLWYSPTIYPLIRDLSYYSAVPISLNLIWQLGIKWFQTVDASALRDRIRCLLIDVFSGKADSENAKPESTSSLENGKPDPSLHSPEETGPFQESS